MLMEQSLPDEPKSLDFAAGRPYPETKRNRRAFFALLDES
jgi:hypothetical protein